LAEDAVTSAKWAEGHTAAQTADSLVAAIREARPGVPLPIRIDTVADVISIHIPTDGGSHYDFTAWIAEDLADLSLSARLSSDPAYFWGRPFERWDYKSFEDMLGEFRALVLAVSSHPTKITEERGLLFRSFALDYQSADRWVRVGGSAALRFSNFRFPQTDRRHELRSHPWSA
jgi:hypothetical protein